MRLKIVGCGVSEHRTNGSAWRFSSANQGAPAQRVYSKRGDTISNRLCSTLCVRPSELTAFGHAPPTRRPPQRPRLLSKAPHGLALWPRSSLHASTLGSLCNLPPRPPDPSVHLIFSHLPVQSILSFPLFSVPALSASTFT